MSLCGRVHGVRTASPVMCRVHARCQQFLLIQIFQTPECVISISISIFSSSVIPKKTVKCATFTFACTLRRDARSFSCASRIYFLHFKNFQTPPSSLRFVQYGVGTMHGKFMHASCNFSKNCDEVMVNHHW